MLQVGTLFSGNATFGRLVRKEASTSAAILSATAIGNDRVIMSGGSHSLTVGSLGPTISAPWGAFSAIPEAYVIIDEQAGPQGAMHVPNVSSLPNTARPIRLRTFSARPKHRTLISRPFSIFFWKGAMTMNFAGGVIFPTRAMLSSVVPGSRLRNSAAPFR